MRKRSPLSRRQCSRSGVFDAGWRSQPSRPSRFNRPFDALPTHEPIEDFPHGRFLPFPILQVRPNPGRAIEQLRIGRKQLAFLLFQVHLMLMSFMITPVRRIWTSSPMQYHLTCQVPVIGMRTATTRVQIHHIPEVPEIGRRTATTLVQIHYHPQ